MRCGPTPMAAASHLSRADLAPAGRALRRRRRGRTWRPDAIGAGVVAILDPSHRPQLGGAVFRALSDRVGAAELEGLNGTEGPLAESETGNRGMEGVWGRTLVRVARQPSPAKTLRVACHFRRAGFDGWQLSSRCYPGLTPSASPQAIVAKAAGSACHWSSRSRQRSMSSALATPSFWAAAMVWSAKNHPCANP